jgi:SPP1 gp7 family putative phage head morphogenesis protein
MPTVAEQIEAGNDYVMGHVYALEDRIVRELFEQYKQAYRDIREDLDRVWQQVGTESWNPENVAAREVLLAQIVSRMRALDPVAANIILSGMLDGYQGAMWGTAWNLDTSVYEAMVDKALVMPVLPVEAIRAQLLAPYLGKTFDERFFDKRVEFELRIKNALIQSQIQGDGIYGVQKRIAGELGIDISRRTKADRMANKRAFYRTAMIARTEILRASNLGALAVYQENDDVLQGYEIITTKDERTCPICAPLDGKQIAFSEAGSNVWALPPYHPQCRCTVLPWLIDQDRFDDLLGKRETFKAWAERNNITQSEHGGVYDFSSQAVRYQWKRANPYEFAKGLPPEQLFKLDPARAQNEPVAQHLADLTGFDAQGNPIYQHQAITDKYIDMLYDIYRLGRSDPKTEDIELAQARAAAVKAASDHSDYNLSQKQLNLLNDILDNDKVEGRFNKIKDNRMIGGYGGGGSGGTSERFVSAAEADAIEMFRERRFKQGQLEQSRRNTPVTKNFYID